MEIKQSRATLAGITAQQRLEFHWLRSREYMKALSSVTENHPPLNQDTPYSTERHRQVDGVVLGYELLNARMLRIEKYLGHERPASGAPSAFEAAKIVRMNVQRGDSDEAIALFLEKWREPARKPGRPKGSNDSDSVALRAIQLYDSNSELWTWPKLADQLLNCKSHIAHDSASECTERLKKSVGRLRSFLKELESD